MNLAAFERVVDDVLDSLPQWVKDKIDNLIVSVERRPTTEQDLHGEGLLGLYEGVSLPERSADYWGALPDQIFIYYEAHVELGLPREELVEEIRRTVLHELAHHLGIDDERLIEIGWD